MTNLTCENEEWRVIPGYPRYEASSLGRIRIKYVREKARNKKPAGSVLVQNACTTKIPYLRVLLNPEFKVKKQFFSHRLICMTFNGMPTAERSEVNHKDGNPQNNRPENLEWCSRLENIRHSIRELGKTMPKGSNSAAAKLTDEQVLEIRAMRPYTPKGTQKREKPGSPALGLTLAKKYGVTKTTISDICKRKIWTHI